MQTIIILPKKYVRIKLLHVLDLNFSDYYKQCIVSNVNKYKRSSVVNLLKTKVFKQIN